MNRTFSLRRKVKKSEISTPSNFEHRIHAGFDARTGTYTGLPKQWQALLGPPRSISRPKPMVDPSCITPVDVAELKTVIRGPSSRYNSPLPFGVTNSPLPSVARSNSLRISATASPVVNVSATRQSFRPSLPPVSQRGYPFNDPSYAPLPLRNQRPPTTTTTTFGVESPRQSHHQITTIVAPPSRTMTPQMQPKLPSTPQTVRQQPKSTEGVSDEEFRNALRFVVDSTDPRSDLTDYKQIGEGSTGVVDAAYKISTKQIVAVKRMNLKKQQRRELLFNEVSILRQYQHPNIVRFFSSHLVDDDLWVVMEFMEGGSLTDIVTATRMTEPQIATISRQVLSALDFLHARKVIHRDIKSDSILLKRDGTVKLSDFGFCGQLSEEVPRRRSLVGTPYWTAAEVIAREPYDTRADIWSFGVMLIEMVEGEPPFFNDQPFQAMKRIRDEPEARFSRHAKVSLELTDLLSHCIVKDINQRWSSKDLLHHRFFTKAQHSSSIAPLLLQLQGNTINGNVPSAHHSTQISTVIQ
ncbi:hypothetical protein CAEBREN_00370 [Caenorhabditis brenneri]|uniref:non-specific serine/threonine protein kinase n=1 Tax=Caenorhabditis brenneri TaxID=135651 RepID=G0N8G4_CAEBE|nr:hypothetical protein CAEBREN_00370 [Caenorhabditis brenneri]